MLDAPETIDRVTMLLHSLQEVKTTTEFLNHFGSQYYIGGGERTDLMRWASPLRSALQRDSLHFVQCDNDEEYSIFMKRRGREEFHFTRRVVKNIFSDISEWTAYVVEEEEQMDIVLNILKRIYYNGLKLQFTSKLSGEMDYNPNW